MMGQGLNFEDYINAMEQMQKLGPLNKLLEMVPGVNAKELQGLNLEDSQKQMEKVKAIIYSMTLKERRNPNLIIGSSSRRKE